MELAQRREQNPDTTSVELTVVVPTYNEATNIAELLRRIQATLEGREYEIVVVDDDSPDGTWELAAAIGQKTGRVRVIRRIEERGLSSAIIRGMSESSGRVIAVIDGDMQHDETILPRMADSVLGGTEVCVASRSVEGGGFGEWSMIRRFASWGATVIARSATGTPVSDPMSGFFAVDREFFKRVEPDLNPRGFKVLLELLARGRPERIDEVGYVFKDRTSGETKLNSSVMYEYLLGIVDLRVGRVVSSQTVSYFLVTLVGMFVNLAGYLGCRLLGYPRSSCAIVGFELALIVTFIGNNQFTFRSTSYRGFAQFKGLLLFQVVSVYGMLIQFSVFETLKVRAPFVSVPYGGSITANAIAILCGSLAMYFVHRRFTWSRLQQTLEVGAP